MKEWSILFFSTYNKSGFLDPKSIRSRFHATFRFNPVLECGLQVGTVKLLLTLPDVLAWHDGGLDIVG